MSSYDNNRINITILKQHKSLFDDELNRFNNSTYGTFSSSYLNSCSDSYINSMSNKVRECYDKIQKGYQSIDKWWTSYNENIEGLELSLAKEASVGSISESSVRSFVSSKLSELSEYKIEYSGVFVDNYYQGNTQLNYNEVSFTNGVTSNIAMATTTANIAISDGSVLDTIGAAFSSAKSAITSWLSGLKNNVSNAFEQLGGFITSLGATVTDKANEIADDFYSGVKEVGANISSTAKSLWNGFTDWVTGTALPVIQTGVQTIADFYQSVYATIAVGVQSLVKGILQFGEALVDFVAIVGAVSNTVKTGIFDLGQWAFFGIKDAITGEKTEWASVTKVMWNNTMGFVSTNYVNGWFDAMTGKQEALGVNGEALMSSDGKYLTISDVQVADTEYGQVLVTLNGDIILTSTGEPVLASSIETLNVYTTGYGKWLDKYSVIAVDGTVANVLSGIGYIAGVVALTIATFGAGSVVAAGGTVSATTAAAATTATNFAITAGAAGMGRGTAEAWADGASTVEGLGYGVATGAWEAFQFWSGAKINGLTLLKPNTIGKVLVNSSSHIILDSASGASEGFVQPLLKMIYKSNDEYYKDMEIFEKYSELFNENGGWMTVKTGAVIGAAASTLGEIPNVVGTAKQIKLNEIDPNIKSVISDDSLNKVTDWISKETNNVKNALFNMLSNTRTVVEATILSPIIFVSKMFNESVLNNQQIFDKIVDNGLFHITSESAASKIVSSGYVKKSDVLTSYGAKKSFFFAGAPTFEEVVKNLDTSSDYMLTAVKIDINAGQLNDLLYRFQDNAIMQKGNFVIPENQANIVKIGLFNENNNLVYKELTPDEALTYKPSQEVLDLINMKKTTLAINSLKVDLAQSKSLIADKVGAITTSAKSKIDTMFKADYLGKVRPVLQDIAKGAYTWVNGILTLPRTMIAGLQYKDVISNGDVVDTILNRGLYHITNDITAGKIVDSGYIKASGALLSMGKEKSFFFAGIPEFSSLTENVPRSLDYIITAVKTKVELPTLRDLSYRPYDYAVSKFGNFNLIDDNVSIVKLGLFVENGNLVYKELSEIDASNYVPSAEVLSKFKLSNNKFIRNVQLSTMAMAEETRLTREFSNQKISEMTNSVVGKVKSKVDGLIKGILKKPEEVYKTPKYDINNIARKSDEILNDSLFDNSVNTINSIDNNFLKQNYLEAFREKFSKTSNQNQLNFQLEVINKILTENPENLDTIRFVEALLNINRIDSNFGFKTSYTTHFMPPELMHSYISIADNERNLSLLNTTTAVHEAGHAIDYYANHIVGKTGNLSETLNSMSLREIFLNNLEKPEGISFVADFMRIHTEKVVPKVNQLYDELNIEEIVTKRTTQYFESQAMKNSIDLSKEKIVGTGEYKQIFDQFKQEERNKLRDSIYRGDDEIKTLNAVHDIISNVTQDNLGVFDKISNKYQPIAFAHSKEYYAKNPDNWANEMFANFTTLKVHKRTDYLDGLKKALGQEWYDSMNKLYNEAIDRLINIPLQ